MIGSTSSLAFRSLLKSSANRAGLNRRSAPADRSDAGRDGVSRGCRRPGHVRAARRADRRGRRADDGRRASVSDIAPGLVRTRRPRDRCCRSRRRKWIRIAASRRTSRSPLRAHARSTASRREQPGSSSRRLAPCCPRLSDPARFRGRRPDARSRDPKSPLSTLARGSPSRASRPRIRWTSTGNSASAAASSISTRRRTRSRSASSSSGTSSSPSGASTARPSDRSSRSIASRSVRSANCCPMSRPPMIPTAFDRSATIVDYARRAGVVGHGVRARGHPGTRRGARTAVARIGIRGRRTRPFGDPVRNHRRTAGRTCRAGSADRTTSASSRLTAAARAPCTCRPCRRWSTTGRIGDWAHEIRAARDRGDAVVFVAASPGRAERTIELLADYEVRARPVGTADDLSSAAVLVTTGQLSRGFHVPQGSLLIFAETDLFEEERRVHERRRSTTRTFLSDFRDLKIGDLVVHVDNGIGRFAGLKRLADHARPAGAGVHGAPLRRRRQAVRPAGTARSRPEVHGRIGARPRQARAARPGRRPRPA